MVIYFIINQEFMCMKSLCRKIESAMQFNRVLLWPFGVIKGTSQAKLYDELDFESLEFK